ncbi:MAG TPA: lipoate--protein ligase family protein, partial [Chloroflexota bacterium]|nr:lipoate--protein ligase family protein [Chloroflexota bacterium]
NRLPASIAERFDLYIRPLVATYRSLGIEAYRRPLNDIQVHGRKIGGTGAASIGEAEVVVGSLMLDFDSEVMSRVLKVSSEKMRDKLIRSLQEYMTTMTRELGHTPDREMVKQRYVEECRTHLGWEIVPGVLSEREEAMARRWDELLLSREWLHQRGGLFRSGVKIREGVRVVDGAHKAPGGLIRVTACLSEGCLDDLSLSGDFTLLPASGVDALEEAVRGIPLRRDLLLAGLIDVYVAVGIQSPGVTPEDFVDAILTVSSEVPCVRTDSV